VEPFVPHPQNNEYYICIQSIREGDQILFTHEGGVDIGDVDAKAKKLMIAVTKPFPSKAEIEQALLSGILILSSLNCYFFFFSFLISGSLYIYIFQHFIFYFHWIKTSLFLLLVVFLIFLVLLS